MTEFSFLGKLINEIHQQFYNECINKYSDVCTFT